MKTKCYHPAILTTFIYLILTGMSGFLYGQDLVDYVNPYIGSIGHLLKSTTPDVQLPRGMIRLTQQTTPGIRDTYLADKIFVAHASEASQTERFCAEIIQRGEQVHTFNIKENNQLSKFGVVKNSISALIADFK